MALMIAMKRLIAIVLTLVCAGCAVSEVKELPPANPLDVSAAPLLGPALWNKELPGLITEVQMAPQGDVVLTTRPEGGRGNHAVYRYSPTGKLRWRAPFKNLVRSLAISPDGSRVFYSAYQDELGVLGSTGKPIWKRRALCRPYALPQNALLCYQDDDDRPGLAFEMWTATGEPHGKKESKLDAITLAFSGDTQRIALGYAGGQIELLDAATGNRIWEKQIDGEIVDLSVADGAERMAVLYTDLKKDKRLKVFNGTGEKLGETVLAFPAEQVIFAPQSKSLLVADPGGAAPRFQIFDTEATPLQAVWERESRRTAEYAVGAHAFGGGWLVYLGVEASAGKWVREAELTVLSAQPPGTPEWRVRIPVPAGGYLYAFDGVAPTAEQPGWLAVATDLGRVLMFRVPKP